MRPIVRGAAVLVAVTCVVWIAVVWHWRATQHELDNADVLLYLCALPVVVFALLLASRWAFDNALARVDARAGAAQPSASALGTSLADGTADAGAGPVPSPWFLLGAWAHTAAGASVEELLAAERAGEPRPGPDAELLDDDGLPVMTARIEGLDTDEVESDLQRHAQAWADAGDALGAVEVPARAVRALAILAPLVDEVSQSLLGLSERWTRAVAPNLAPDDERAARPSSSAQASGHDKVIRVRVAWPLDWDDATCASAAVWLSDRLCAPLDGAVPRSAWSLAGQRLCGAELLMAAQRMLDDLAREGRDDPVVLMACHSDLDAAGIGALQASQRLFHSTRSPMVAMAGEGAAVLVAFAVASPAFAADVAEPVRIAGLTLGRRSQSIEAPGRKSPDETIGLVRQSLSRAGLGGDGIAELASDADQHTARTTELFGVTLALMPTLDANDDLCLAGSVTGRLEAAAPLMSLACAAARARESARPVVALSLADPHWRIAAVLTPEPLAQAVAA